MTTAYFPVVFACRSLWFDLFILRLSSLTFSALALVLQQFTVSNCLQISEMFMSGFA